MNTKEAKSAFKGFLEALGYDSDDIRIHFDKSGNLTFQGYATVKEDEEEKTEDIQPN